MLTQFADLLTVLTNEGSSTAKVELIRLHGNHSEVKDLFRRALDDTITYGVKQLPAHFVTPAVDEDTGLSMSISLLDMLETRRLTGHRAQAEIAQVFSHLCDRRRDALRKIILKDLRCGVSAKTVNKALPGTVPEFCVQLAPSKLVVPSELKYPVWAEIKYDGYRGTRVRSTLHSRNGNTFDNFEDIVQVANLHLPKDIVLDMEVLSPLGFQALKKRAGAEVGKNTAIPVYAVVFDCLSLDQWDAKSCATPFLVRRELVKEMVSRLPSDLFKVSEGRVVHNAEDLLAFYQVALDQGFEGLMVKDMDGKYTFARNKTWQKMKPYETLDLKVTGVQEGNGKYAGTLGALEVEGTELGKFIKGTVGSGFSDKLRDDYWANPPLGKTIEIRYLEITKAEGNDYYALRHGTFVRERDDK